MNQDMLEIRCDELADLAKELPAEVAVIRELLAAAEESCNEPAG
ncbi:MAG: hypothetical protein RLZ44_39 [Pseudomonadota bacterium]